jgi:hypothetical protein
MAHTPGPWIAKVWHISTGDGRIICRLGGKLSLLEARGNVHLIAAAPEMLEAIEEFLQGYEETCRQEHHLGSAIEGALYDVIEPLYAAFRKAKYGEDS